MEILHTSGKLQQSQLSSPKNGGIEIHKTHNIQEIQKVQIEKQEAPETNNDQKSVEMDSQEQLDKLINQLNRSLDPFNTTLRFGFDNESEDFYVSVIDTKTNNILRRFPVEKAQEILPKIEEINGLIFDQKV